MSRKKRANVAPEFEGHIYIGPGETFWKLLFCGSEPTARMRNLETELVEELQVSGFKDFVRLEPVSPIPEAKKKRKPRSDAGETHAKKTVESSDPIGDAARKRVPSPTPAEEKGKFDVTPVYYKTPLTEGESYEVGYGEHKVVGATYKDAVQGLFKILNLSIGGKELKVFLETIPECPEKNILVNILKEEN